MDLIIQIFIIAIPVLFAITVHEVAHGWVAYHYGDKTAWMMGRLTLNPIKHIDPIGTVLVPALLAYYGGFIFGWAKPVPVNFENLSNPKRDMALVAAAGPATNLLMAFFWAIMMKLSITAYFNGIQAAQIIVNMSYIGIHINIILMIVNLIPIPPLDGSRIVSSFLPPRLAWKYNQLERFGILIVLGAFALLFYSGLGIYLVRSAHQFIANIFGLPP